ncbi:MAG: hypothetical protein RL685_2121 [Pseudomonadota bacterium]|jgi:hypothetical protein
MKDLKPLLRDDASDFERQLLNAVRRERPSAQLQASMRGTLGLTGPVAWLGAVRAALSTTAGKSALGVAVVGLVAGGVFASGVVDLSGSSAAPPAPATVLTAPAAPRPVLEAAPVLTQPRAPRAAEARAAEARTAEAHAAEASASDTEDLSSRQLREEILLLDRARGALQRGSRAGALRELDHYQERFPQGILSREATQLRQQARLEGAPNGPR